MPATQRYPDELRHAVVTRAIEIGPAQAAREHNVNPATVRSWMKRAEVATGCAPENLRNAHAVASAKAEVSREQRRERLADRLLEIAEMSAERAAAIMSEANLRDLVGLFTRAIHDHQLLTGAATSRAETTGKENAHFIADELANRRQARAA